MYTWRDPRWFLWESVRPDNPFSIFCIVLRKFAPILRVVLVYEWEICAPCCSQSVVSGYLSLTSHCQVQESGGQLTARDNLCSVQVNSCRGVWNSLLLFLLVMGALNIPCKDDGQEEECPEWCLPGPSQSLRYVVTLPAARRKLILIILLQVHCDCKHLDHQLVSYYNHNHNHSLEIVRTSLLLNWPGWWLRYI